MICISNDTHLQGRLQTFIFHTTSVNHVNCSIPGCEYGDRSVIWRSELGKYTCRSYITFFSSFNCHQNSEFRRDCCQSCAEAIANERWMRQAMVSNIRVMETWHLGKLLKKIIFLRIYYIYFWTFSACMAILTGLCSSAFSLVTLSPKVFYIKQVTM